MSKRPWLIVQEPLDDDLQEAVNKAYQELENAHKAIGDLWGRLPRRLVVKMLDYNDSVAEVLYYLTSDFRADYPEENWQKLVQEWYNDY